jgi:hypothetical protein
VVDSAPARPEVLWISAPCARTACSECGDAPPPRQDDVACVARLEDGRWGVLARDDATRTFTRESELPFALALVHAVTGRA